MPLAKRLDACIAMKEDGNRQLQSGRPEEACHTYEQVVQQELGGFQGCVW